MIRKHFFKCLQVCSFIYSRQNQQYNVLPLSSLEERVTKDFSVRGLIFYFYDLLTSQVPKHAQYSVGRLEAWRNNIKEEIMEEDWKEICEDAQKLSINICLRSGSCVFILHQFNCLSLIIVHK